MPFYEMKYDPQEGFSDFCQSVIGRRPTMFGLSSGFRLLQIEFDPELTPAERNALRNALPDVMKILFSFTVREGTLDSGIIT